MDIKYSQSRNKYGDYIIQGETEDEVRQIVIHKETDRPLINPGQPWWSSDLYGAYRRLKDIKVAARYKIEEMLGGHR